MTLDIDKLKMELRRDEGFSTKPYRDSVGKLTIGVGRNIEDLGLSVAEALFMLDNDVARTIKELDLQFPWWRKMSGDRQRVLANMAFNMGITKLLGFKNTLAAMESGDYEAAATGMENSKWATQVGVRAVRLIGMMRGKGMIV